MIYNYPRPQDVYNDTVFLMAETVDSNQFSKYVIPFRLGNTIKQKIITHDFLLAAIDRGLIIRTRKIGAFNDKEFYRIPLELQLTLFLTIC